jgi:hypothetical protein
MPKQVFSLEPGGPKRLEISWGFAWRNLQANLDGKPLLQARNRAEVQAGRETGLPDGSQLRIRLVGQYGSLMLEVTRDGLPLPYSATSLEAKHRVAYNVLFFIGGLNVLLGILGAGWNLAFLQSLGVGLFSVIYGLVFILFGYLARARSLPALYGAIAIFILDGLLGALVTLLAGFGISVIGVLVRVLLLIPLIRAIPALRQMNKESTGASH